MPRSDEQRDRLTTTASHVTGEPVKGRPVTLPPRQAETAPQDKQWVRTVPTSKVNGSVRLRYIPRCPGAGSCDSSTET